MSNSILDSADAPEGSPGWFQRHFPQLFDGSVTAVGDALKAHFADAPGTAYGSVLPISYTPDAQGNAVPGSRALAWPEGVRSTMRGIGDLLNGPVTGTVSPEATMALAGTGAGAGQLFGPVETTLGMFTGMNARHYTKTDWLAQKAASDAVRAGQDPEAVRVATGWFKAPDGQWRSEISDQGASVNLQHPAFKAHGTDKIDPMADFHSFTSHPQTVGNAEWNPTIKTWDFVNQQDWKLGEILNHPELYKAYPDLKDIPVKDMGFSFGSAGSHNPETDAIRLGGNSGKEILNTLLHETQHAIQSREGFASGGNSGMFISDPEKTFIQATSEANRTFRQRAGDAGFTQEDMIKLPYAQELFADPARLARQQKYNSDDVIEKKALLDRWNASGLHGDWQQLQDMKKLASSMQSQASATYQRLLGEVEARDVEARRNLSPQDLHANTPAALQPQVVGYGGKSIGSPLLAPAGPLGEPVAITNWDRGVFQSPQGQKQIYDLIQEQNRLMHQLGGFYGVGGREAVLKNKGWDPTALKWTGP